jgi:diketogulonate reductase-like aldo/keto reductase
MTKINSIRDCTVLNNQVEMPWLGLGVFSMKNGAETENAVRRALDAGYRSIDTAAAYGNEASVGKAIADSGILRQEIFVTTKVWNSDQGYQSTLKAFDESRKKLKLDAVDLYLVHWPVQGRYIETWKALEKIYRDGLARAIGLSNFQIHHMKDILGICEVKPVLNQVEFHPQLRQKELHQFCIDNQVQLEAWSPLGQGNSLKNPTIVGLAQKYNKTPAQLLLRWDLQHEVVTIPKSSHPQRIIENTQVFDFEISPEDVLRLDRLDERHRYGDDPDNFDF